MLIERVREVLPPTPAGERAAWVFERLLTVASGSDPPSGAEIALQYAPAWLAEVPTDGSFFAELAPMLAATEAVFAERSRSDEAASCSSSVTAASDASD
ncbi:MAG TPA: hypothetical protein VGQ20_09575 [Acidimicrobiales bacterium]|nr:hypothetical protein [Acidimicrobiales bacterium]